MTRKIDIKADAERLAGFIRDFVAQNGFTRAVIGLSGGVDSSLSAALGAKALGPENVLGVIMPYKNSDPQSEKDALTVAEKLGLKTERVDISPMIDTFFADKTVSSVRRGNKMARERMSVLFDIAARDHALVLGTSNKTEICLGYSTWYGDSACSLNPLGGLYKRNVRRMAEYLGVPANIIAKDPSADLWPGQTDEGELGLTYDMADRILDMIVEQGVRSLEKILETGADAAAIEKVVDRMNRFLYKRSLPATELLGGNPIPDKVILS